MSCFTASVSARGKSDKVDLNVNRTFLVVLVGGWKIIPQLCKDPAAIEIKIYTNIGQIMINIQDEPQKILY